MNRFRPNGIAAALCWVALAATLPAVGLAQGELDPGDAVPTANAGRCHCPCLLYCGHPDVQCDCTMHEADCHKCHCATATVRPADLELLATIDRPVLELGFAPWFEAEPYPEIKAAIEVWMADTGRQEDWVSRWVQDPVSPSRFVPDASFDRAAFGAWLARADFTKTGRLYAAVTDDPGTYRIADGDLNHLGHSLEKTISLVMGRGESVPIFRSDSTLGWEMRTYLLQTVAGLEPSAFAEDMHDVRPRMLGRVDAIDLQLKGGDFSGALVTLDGLMQQARDRWLVRDDRYARSAICAFGKMRNLLSPGALTCE